MTPVVAARYEIVLIETVVAGQSEVEIARIQRREATPHTVVEQLAVRDRHTS